MNHGLGASALSTAGAAMTYGSGSVLQAAQSTNPPEMSALELALMQLAEAQGQLNRVEAAINRASGYDIEAQKGSDAPMPDALLERIGIAINNVVSRTRLAADRLERIA